AAEIGDGAIGEFRIRDMDGRFVETAYLCGTKADILDRAFDHTVNQNPVAGVEAFFGNHGQPGNQVFEHVLRTKRNGNAEQAETGENRCDFNAPYFQYRGN